MNYIDKIVNLIIRPLRDQYHTKRFGDPQINIYTKAGEHIKVLRQDRVILNKHNEHIHLSYYAIQSINISDKSINIKDKYHQFISNKNTQQYYNNLYYNQQSSTATVTSESKVQHYSNKCVIYLHANNGSRLQGTAYLQKLISAHSNVCLFDCSGSGVSQGQYVTLGLKQSRDLDSIVNFLTKQKKITQVILWGRSMGAATAIIYGSKHSKVKICGMVLDSPFKDLQKLIIEIASDKTGFPRIFFQPLIPLIRSQILKKTGYNIEELKLKRYIEKDTNLQTSRSKRSMNQRQTQKSGKDIIDSSRINAKNKLSTIPALFVVSKKDKFVRCSHGQKLFRRYKCEDKQIMYIDTEHHQMRCQNDVDKIINFIVTHFNQNDCHYQDLQNANLYPLKFNKNVLTRSRLDSLTRSRLDSRRTLQKPSQSQKTKISLNKYNPNTFNSSPLFQQNPYNNSFRTQLNNFYQPQYQKDSSEQNKTHVAFTINPNLKNSINSNNINNNNTQRPNETSSYLLNYKRDPSFYHANFIASNKTQLTNQSISNMNASFIRKKEKDLKVLRHQFSNESFSSHENINKNQMSSISYVPSYNKRTDDTNIRSQSFYINKEENTNRYSSSWINQQQKTPHYLDKNTCKYMNKGKISLAWMLSQQEKVHNSQMNLKNSIINIKQPYLSLSKVSYQPFEKYKYQSQSLPVRNNNNKQLITKELQKKYDETLKTSIIGHSQIVANNYLFMKERTETQHIPFYNTQTYKSLY